MLIFEGSDLAGKSTLAMALVGEVNRAGLHAAYLHNSCPKAPETEAGLMLKEVKQHEFTHALIVDRFLIGDFAYRTVWPREHPLTGQDFKRFAWFLRATQSHIFMMMPSYETVKGRYSSRGDDMVTLDNILVAHHRYSMFVKAVGDRLPMTILTEPTTASELYEAHEAVIKAALMRDSSLKSDLYYMTTNSGYAFHSRNGDAAFDELDLM
jgi:hypothetical protein